MTRAFSQLLGRETHTWPKSNDERQSRPKTEGQSDTQSTKPKQTPPKLLTLGGDHSISLPQLRALSAAHNTTLSILHLDAHLDTWDPRQAYPGPNETSTSAHPETPKDASTSTAPTLFTHGSMLWLAHREGLLRPGSLVHAGLRTRLQSPDDEVSDDEQGWVRLPADSIDEMVGAAGVGGAKAVAEYIVDKIGTEAPVYLTLDIDVLDPSVAPGTGTPEAGGWTARELIHVLRGVEALNIVAADVVEVSPAYDGRGEQTGVVAAHAVYEILTSMVKRGLQDLGSEGNSE